MAYYWAPYVPVARRRANAQKQLKKLLKKGENPQPVVIEGRTIAKSFWGKAWCDHLESFHDYENRLPRGRTYARNGSVCHLTIQPGLIEALVSGSMLYKIKIEIAPLKPAAWKKIVAQCSGQIGSMLDLLRGKISQGVMAVVTDRAGGLLPQPGEIKMNCNCPDWAGMCKHLAAVLYGVGSRLDRQPELLFELRGVDPQQLISADLKLPAASGAQPAIADDQLGAIFGIDIDTGTPASPKKPVSKATRKKADGTIGDKIAQQAVKQSVKKAVKKAAPAAAKTALPGQKRAGVTKKVAPPKTPVWDGRTITAALIVLLRNRLDLTQKELALKLGVSMLSVVKWEKTPGRLNLYARSRIALQALFDEHL